ncbi:MAG: hypothetical protein NC344_11540 [Bacteroidales bacterium]|nr:hypothetical protein [Bacteroidales bacterium]MCM1148437.1 hypothetical protein [Bacteroidales bacterium]MCM1510582.1 hypothetical protein [Clostridium sp.]
MKQYTKPEIIVEIIEEESPLLALSNTNTENNTGGETGIGGNTGTGNGDNVGSKPGFPWEDDFEFSLD